MTEKTKHYSQELWVSLLCNNTFHHKVCNYFVIGTVLTQSQNLEEVKGFGEHHDIMDIFCDALFKDKKTYGVKYSKYFNSISINLLAPVFTMVGTLAVAVMCLLKRILIN